MNVKELQNLSVRITEKIDEKRNIAHNPELTVVHLIEELGEIAREVYNEKSGRKEVNRKNLEGEFADAMFLIMHLASKYNVDMEDAVRKKAEELKNRYGFEI